jgi:hypothetical protein
VLACAALAGGCGALPRAWAPRTAPRLARAVCVLDGPLQEGEAQARPAGRKRVTGFMVERACPTRVRRVQEWRLQRHAAGCRPKTIGQHLGIGWGGRPAAQATSLLAGLIYRRRGPADLAQLRRTVLLLGGAGRRRAAKRTEAHPAHAGAREGHSCEALLARARQVTVVIPPRALGGANAAAVRALQVGAAASACPASRRAAGLPARVARRRCVTRA